MQLTSKGQIPFALRKQFGLLTGTEVTFEPANGGVLIKSAATGRLRRLKVATRRSRGGATAELSTDEVMKLTRG